MNKLRIAAVAASALLVAVAGRALLAPEAEVANGPAGARPPLASGPPPTGETAPAPAVAPVVVPAAPPDLRALAGRLGGGMIPPTPEQIAEERRIVREQVADAARSLRGRQVDERVAGVEQLAAYPTREAEARLGEALARDPAAAVRAAAAGALAAVKQPREASVRALLAALEDRDGETRSAALATLAGYLNGLAGDSAGFRRIRAGLAKLAGARRLDPETRAEVRALLADSAP